MAFKDLKFDDKVCKRCEAVFTPKRAKQMFCNPDCTALWHRERTDRSKYKGRYTKDHSSPYKEVGFNSGASVVHAGVGTSKHWNK